MASKLTKFYVRCAPGHTETSYLEVKNILAKLKGTNSASKSTVEKEREVRGNNSKNGLFVKTEFKHGMEIAMKSLTIQDIECVVVEETCKTKRDVMRRLKKFPFADFIRPNSLSTMNDFSSQFQLHSRANKSFVNSSRFLKEGFCDALEASGLLKDRSVKPSNIETIPPQSPTTPRLLNIIRLSLLENRLTVSVSLAGNMELYKRTYKDMRGIATAPLPEHHASACTLWALNTIHHKVVPLASPSSGTSNSPLNINNIIVPFAGTGTLGFESLLVLLDTSAGAGLFCDRKFAFDLFPCSHIGRSNSSGNDGTGEKDGDRSSTGSDGSAMNFSTNLRHQMRADIAAKFDCINQEDNYERTIPIPYMHKNAKILFSDINDDALSCCNDNITSFIHASGSIFSSKLFSQPMKIDFFTEDVLSILFHDNGVLKGCDLSNYMTGTTMVLLNPPFGFRLAKKSSTTFMFTQIALQLIAMRGQIQLLRQKQPLIPFNERSSDSDNTTKSTPTTPISSTVSRPACVSFSGGSTLETKAKSESFPVLAGMCLCPDVPTWSTFITTLTIKGEFGCETTHFSLGGKDMRAVCFWSE